MSGEGALGAYDWRELNRAALSAADLAFIEERGTGAQRVEAAITAYLWSIANREPFGASGSLFAYPSLNQWRAERARMTTPTPRTTPASIPAGGNPGGNDG